MLLSIRQTSTRARSLMRRPSTIQRWKAAIRAMIALVRAVWTTTCTSCEPPPKSMMTVSFRRARKAPGPMIATRNSDRTIIAMMMVALAVVRTGGSGTTSGAAGPDQEASIWPQKPAMAKINTTIAAW